MSEPAKTMSIRASSMRRTIPAGQHVFRSPAQRGSQKTHFSPVAIGVLSLSLLATPADGRRILNCGGRSYAPYTSCNYYLFALEAYASATAIVALWTPVGVVIRADGWEVPNSGPPLVTCKTIVVGNVAVAEAGWLDAGTHNLRAVIRDELDRDGPISGAGLAASARPTRPARSTVARLEQRGLGDPPARPGSARRASDHSFFATK